VEFDWLDDGNLYILLPECLVGAWGGIVGGDYDRACEASDQWLNVLPVAEGVGLILGGDPGMALVVPRESGEVLLVRWIFASDEHALVDLAIRGDGVVRTEPDLLFESPDPQWRLFDAAAEPRAGGTASRSLTLPIGRLRAQTADLESGENAGIVHRITAEPTPDS
jgi:hypothetical protein